MGQIHGHTCPKLSLGNQDVDESQVNRSAEPKMQALHALSPDHSSWTFVTRHHLHVDPHCFLHRISPARLQLHFPQVEFTISTAVLVSCCPYSTTQSISHPLLPPFHMSSPMPPALSSEMISRETLQRSLQQGVSSCRWALPSCFAQVLSSLLPACLLSRK